ncbi:MAG: MaoC family dehydratase [Acidimicrobiia bacterium]|nr:MaoC family dehydratase [Acidimicrobiia bacterium]
MAQVSAPPGDRLPALTKRVTQDTIDAWAKVSGDSNPLHTDPEFAATSRFGGTIAHGHLPLAWFCELLISWAGVAWLSAGEMLDVRFVAPVRPGALYEVTGTVADVQDGRAVIELEIAGPEGTCVRGGATAPIPDPAEGNGAAT